MIERHEDATPNLQPATDYAALILDVAPETAPRIKVERDRKTEFKRLFIGNPIQMEVIRFRRRFFNVTSSPKLNQTLVGLVVFSYLLILGLLYTIHQDLPAGVVGAIQLAGMMLIGIVGAHASIAGEKDRRSWDLLQVAPVSQEQIVVGKFMGVMTLLFGLQAAFLPAFMMAHYPNNQSFWDGLTNLFLSELLCFSVGAAFSAGTIYLSSRMKNANTTLVTGIAAGIGVYALVPMLSAVFLTGPGTMDFFMSLFHPFYWVCTLLFGPFWSGHGAFIPLSGPVGATLGIVVYSAITAFSLFMTGRRLTKTRGRE